MINGGFAEKERMKMKNDILQNILNCFQALVFGASHLNYNLQDENEVN